jgi:hypothetical protein
VRLVGRFALILFVATLALAGCSKQAPVHAASPATPAPAADFGENMVGCMSAKGWDVGVDAQGRMTTPHDGVPNSQIEQYRNDAQECLANFGYDKFTITPEMASSFYDKQVALAQCLRGLGYVIPDPPSREAYVEELVNTGGASWFPWQAVQDAVHAGDSNASKAAEAVCPQPTSW